MRLWINFLGVTVMKIKLNVLCLVVALSLLTGCAKVGKHMNPFAEPPTPEALGGQPNDHALRGGAGSEDSARAALTAMSTYQRAHYPQPNNPVMKPAVVRLMWIPDHLNRSGDLVPAHFYYLKVKSEQWAVQDAFELEGQLGAKTDSSAIPYVTSDKKK